MKLRIRSKMLLSFMTMVALIIALVILALFALRIVANGNRQLVYVQEKSSLVSNLQMTIDRSVTALGDYLISGKKARRTTFIQLALLSTDYLEALERYRGVCPEAGDELVVLEHRTIVGLRGEMEKIDAISREILALADKIDREHGHDLIKEMGSVIKEALDVGSGAESGEVQAKDLATLGSVLGISTREAQKRLSELEALSRTISESRWQELTAQLIEAKDSALEKIAELREIAQREGVKAVEVAGHARRQARKCMLVGAVVTLVLGLGLALYLTRSLSRPIVDLERGARLIGEGNFDHRMEIQTGDELEELASRFNAMASNLKSSYQELEERVRERTEELRRSHEQLRRLFDGISDGISVIRRDYRVVSANKGIARMVGKKEEDVKFGICYELYNGSDILCSGCPVGETFRSGVPSSAQLSWSTPGRKVKEMEIYIFPLLEEEGEVTHVIEYAKDISDKKVMERSMFQSAKLAGIGTLAAGVAHEIRNPLGIIKTSADIVRRNSGEGEQNLEMAEFIIDEVDRLNRVVSRLLNFAKPSKPLIQPCDVHEVLDRALALVGPQYRLQDLHVVKRYARDLPPTRADSEQLCQVFLNLVLNAVQSMAAGGSLTLTTGSDDDGLVWISVEDTGQGIEENTLGSIFDPFFSTKKDGSGLGLPIVQRIVDNLKGRVEVNSSPGRGTTFTVRLPIS